MTELQLKRANEIIGEIASLREEAKWLPGNCDCLRLGWKSSTHSHILRDELLFTSRIAIVESYLVNLRNRIEQLQREFDNL